MDTHSTSRRALTHHRRRKMGDFASMHETEHNTQRTKEKKVEIAEGGIVLGALLKLPVRDKPQYSKGIHVSTKVK